jgi:hypothetical protein
MFRKSVQIWASGGAPPGIFPCHPDHQRFQFGFDPGPAWVGTVLGAVELPGDQPPIPGQDGVGLGDAGDLAERMARRFPISASVARSGSDSRNLDGSLPLKLRFLAARYSFWSKSSWFTVPVTYANSRAHFLSFMPTAYLTPTQGGFSFLTIRGFVWLTFDVGINEEEVLTREHGHTHAFQVLALVCFAVFADNLLRRIDGADQRVQILAEFGPIGV